MGPWRPFKRPMAEWSSHWSRGKGTILSTGDVVTLEIGIPPGPGL